MSMDDNENLEVSKKLIELLNELKASGLSDEQIERLTNKSVVRFRYRRGS
ncbi:gp65 [Mycobacterium phage Bxb1]|uniref:Uncharacterized protein n=1 Tax=Mycobacterium phage Bxb1 TaxID=2902907 RepID=Q9B056_BPMB1|nr:gp65 [Mycobacterium phage Bxb1]AAG59770.1 hypothetical protein PBI_BXB1_65 [Mycobacterium phage Bxb1]